MSGASPSQRIRATLRLLVPVLVFLNAFAASAGADATCVRVRNLLRKGLNADEVSQFTGLSQADVHFCAGAPNVPMVIDRVGPPPHGAAGPAPHGAAGPAPLGAAGPAPHGAAGPAPHGAAGPAPHGAAGPAPGGFAPQ
jgi:hypothetical protein